MSKQIWLVWADRGDYSDRSEYAVCWYSTAEWRRRCADSDNPWDLVPQAQADIGDPSWGYYDDTDYSAFALERGGKVK